MEDEVNKKPNQNNFLDKIKSKYIIKKLFENITKRKMLNLIKYYRCFQNNLGLNLKDYKEFLQIEIEIEIAYDKYGKFINYRDDEESYYHIYNVDNKEQIKLKEKTKYDLFNKVKIIIDFEIKSLVGLFKKCDCIKKINFIKYNRTDIDNLNELFSGCQSLEELNISQIKTEKVKYMKFLFDSCTALKALDVSNFKTNNVKDMEGMFKDCESLEELNVFNFETDKVTSMSSMFQNCSSLQILDLLMWSTEQIQHPSIQQPQFLLQFLFPVMRQ